MTIEQTIDIPADHRVLFEFLAPEELPAGPVRVELKLTPETAPHGEALTPLLAMLGIDRGKNTLDAYFARKRADKAREDARIERQLHTSKSFHVEHS